MCRCCQECLEACYWHLIEERFCFDESIALYEEPVKKDEKNNNMFDNMAFYDSVSVIAGRAIVTIDPIPPKEDKLPIVQQPKRLTWQVDNSKSYTKGMSKSVPTVYEEKLTETESSSDDDKKVEPKTLLDPQNTKALSTSDVYKKVTLLDPTALEINPTRKKSLRERRMSKSLYLKIDQPKEIPIIRQQSMPKFYLDTPEDNQSDTALCRAPSTVLTSPVINRDGFEYDLYSVVQLEKTKSFNISTVPVPVHKEQSNRFMQIKEKIKLKKSKSTANTSNLLNQSSLSSNSANTSSQ